MCIDDWCRCVISGNESGDVLVWTTSKDNAGICGHAEPDLIILSSGFADLLQVVDKIKIGGSTADHTLLDASSSHPILLSGLTSDLHSLQIHDITSKQSLFRLAPDHMTTKPRPLHALAFLDVEPHPQPHPHRFVTCSGAGCVDLWDSREDKAVASATPTHDPTATPTHSTTNATPTSQFSMAISGHAHPNTCLAVLETSGTLRMYDLRKLHPPLAICRLSSSEPALRVGRGFSCEDVQPHPCVRVSSTYPHPCKQHIPAPLCQGRQHIPTPLYCVRVSSTCPHPYTVSG